MFSAVVILCHNDVVMRTRMLYRAHARGMTEDYAYFYYDLLPEISMTKPWEVNPNPENPDDKEMFKSFKQVFCIQLKLVYCSNKW